MPEKIRVGIVGAGSNTRARHIPGLQQQEAVEIVSVCNRSKASAERVATQFGIRRIYNHWQELVEASDTNAIVVGAWPYLHCPVTLKALDAGKHVMCEARMAMNAYEAHLMHESARAHPMLTTQVAPSPYTLELDPTIQALLDEQFIGNVQCIEVCATTGSFVNPEMPLHWRQDRSLSGLNVMSLGIWYEAVMRWVGEATSVMARGRTFVNRRKDENGHVRTVSVPDHIDVIADMACGAQARFSLSQVTGHAKREYVYLFGSKGTLKIENNRLYAGQSHAAALSEIHIPPAERGSWRVEEEFVRAIRGEGAIRHTPFEDGVKYMEFTEAAARSMAEGRVAPLPL